MIVKLNTNPEGKRMMIFNISKEELNTLAGGKPLHYHSKAGDFLIVLDVPADIMEFLNVPPRKK